MVWFLSRQSVCTCVSCHHLYRRGCIGGLGYAAHTNFSGEQRRVDAITEQVRTGFPGSSFSLLVLSLSRSVLPFHQLAPL